MQSYPDIEIYLAHCDIARLDAWLQQTIGAEPLSPAGKRQWRTLGHAAAGEVPVLVVEKAADGFASLWLDSPETPWVTDAACAREAAARLGCEVRCSLGGWQPGDDPDRFLQVLPDGSEQAIDWPDSGQ
ncbi:hypothetical protein DFP85_12924 [Halomonas ventosae]|uniref:Uncharacterized protein n=1 Tax=Halomonas ventosae TaxID=229007 RepID=A0A4R6ZDH8_9GAMM|nr:hypothetical protein [Halomonas ventosae]TDR50191.1 hypothetical protein DFP85_12924 [Halomonas ventosae]